MRVRKLLDWRKLLIYSHRWLGITVGAVFVAWWARRRSLAPSPAMDV